jgi:hypothetical protein
MSEDQYCSFAKMKLNLTFVEHFITRKTQRSRIVIIKNEFKLKKFSTLNICYKTRSSAYVTCLNIYEQWIITRVVQYCTLYRHTLDRRNIGRPKKEATILRLDTETQQTLDLMFWFIHHSDTLVHVSAVRLEARRGYLLS